MIGDRLCERLKDSGLHVERCGYGAVRIRTAIR